MKKDIMMPPKSLSKQNVIYPITSSKPVASSARHLVWILFILAIANGVFLYFFPRLAETHYAWPIKPPINAAFMGAGYLAGMVATGLALFSVKYWRSVRSLFPAFFMLGLSLFIATMMHADRFKWDYYLTWFWTLIYAAIPIGSAVVWILHERNIQTLPQRDTRLESLRLTSLVLGIAITLLAFGLFIAPHLFIPIWPWQITPLLARVFAGWYFLAGVLLLMTSLSLRQVYEIPLGYATLVAWNALSLLLVLIYPSSITFFSLGFWAWLILHIIGFIFTGWSTLKAMQLMRQENQTL